MIISDYDAFQKMIHDKGEFIIYGAQYHAHCLYGVLKFMHPEVDLLCFMVSRKENNPETIEGIKVEVLTEPLVYSREIPIVVATSEKFYEEIEGTLLKAGFRNIVAGTFGGRFDNQLREQYFKRDFMNGRMPYVRLSDLSGSSEEKCKSLCMYMAKSVFDKPLISSGEIPEYIKVVQAGAALTKDRIADCTDDCGDHISQKNKNYCECTVTHYVWKNATEDYVGLCHYRRRFCWSERDLELLRNAVADVVLPNPVLTIRGSYEIHRERYVDEQTFNTMLQILEEYYPAYYKTALEMMQENMFYPCNILLAKREIFNTYAEWMFDVLFKVEKLCGDESVRTDRYLGYLAEHLTGFYFAHNMGKYRIVHSMMEILK